MQTFANYQRHSIKEYENRVQNPIEWTLGNDNTQLVIPRHTTRGSFNLSSIRLIPVAMMSDLFDPLAFEWPPDGTRLSDVAVYRAIKLLPVSKRRHHYPGDFDSGGNLRVVHAQWER